VRGLLRSVVKSIAHRIPGLGAVLRDRNHLREAVGALKGQLALTERELAMTAEHLATARRELSTITINAAELKSTVAVTVWVVDQMRGQLGLEFDARQFVPPGHFYSPIPSWSEVEKDSVRIFSRSRNASAGAGLDPDRQMALLERLSSYYDSLPYTESEAADRRYHFKNPAYSYTDAIFLYLMIRHLKPASIVEVGSGFSSAAMLDIDELFLGNSIE
jgi:hypothetical protein